MAPAFRKLALAAGMLAFGCGHAHARALASEALPALTQGASLVFSSTLPLGSDDLAASPAAQGAPGGVMPVGSLGPAGSNSRTTVWHFSPFNLEPGHAVVNGQDIGTRVTVFHVLESQSSPIYGALQAPSEVIPLARDGVVSQPLALITASGLSLHEDLASSPVPEPSHATLLGLGMAVLLLALRRGYTR